MSHIRGVAPITNKRIGKLLALRRKDLRLSLEEVGYRIVPEDSEPLDRSTISGWEGGHRPIPKKHIDNLASLYGLDPALIDPEAA